MEILRFAKESSEIFTEREDKGYFYNDYYMEK